MDIKRVAFETKPVSRAATKAPRAEKREPTALESPQPRDRTIKREEIAALVDKFLSKKITEAPVIERPVLAPEPQVVPESPVKTIIHELRPQSSNGSKPSPVDFVSEDDVRKAIEKGDKIYITAKTILTPSARDLGEEKEIFAKV